MKRTILLLAPILIVAISAATLFDADASDAEDDEFTVDGFSYCTIGGDEVSLISLDESLLGTAVVVPDTVTYQGNNYRVVTIDYGVFYSLKVETVTIGNNVHEIKGNNFNICSNLVSVIISDSVDTIGSFCFNSCDNLANVTFGAHVTKLGLDSFTDCPKLTRAGFDENGNPAVFFDHDALVFNTVLMSYLGEAPETYNMDDRVTSISPSAFHAQNKLKTLVLSSKVNTIGNFAFSDCEALQSVEFPDDLLVIDRGAFANCKSLRSVHFPDGLRMVGEQAFCNCLGLEEVTIEYWLSYIGNGAFASCPSLKGFDVSESNTSFVCEDGILYTRNGSSILGNVSTLLQYPQGKITEGGTLDLSKKTGLSAIKYMAFSFYDTGDGSPVPLRKIILPENLQEIEYGAFRDCYSLEEINIPRNVNAIEAVTFSECTSLKHVELNEGLGEISGLSFVNCVKLSEISFPSTLTIISSAAFVNCTSLKDMVLPDSSVFVDEFAFAECVNLEKVTVINAGTILSEKSLDISDMSGARASLVLSVPSGYSVPEGVFGTGTDGTVEVRGEPPYPYENWVAIFVIVLIMIGLLRFIRRV